MDKDERRYRKPKLESKLGDNFLDRDEYKYKKKKVESKSDIRSNKGNKNNINKRREGNVGVDEASNINNRRAYRSKHKVGVSHDERYKKNINSSRKIHKKKKKRINKKAVFLFMILIMAFVFLIALVSFALKGIFSAKNQNHLSLLKKGTVIEGVNVSGMEKNDAFAVVTDHCKISMSVNIDGNSLGLEQSRYELGTFIRNEISLLIDEALVKGKGEYNLKSDNIISDIEKEADKIEAVFSKPAQNAGIDGFNNTNKNFVYGDGKIGIKINKDILIKDIKDAIDNKEFDKSINIQYEKIEPQIQSAADVEKMYTLIGTFTSLATDDANRNNNIMLALNSIDGYILKKNEEFSFNNVTDKRDEQAGYKSAGIYAGGNTVEEMAEGVSQVSSTLYNAILFSGLSASERHELNYEPTFVKPGQEAAVNDVYDFKFINDTVSSIGIRATMVVNKITVSIYGIPVLNSGEKIYVESKKTADIDIPEPVVEIDNSIPVGEKRVIAEGSAGSEYTTTLIKKNGNEVIETKDISKSVYNGKAGLIKQNQNTEANNDNVLNNNYNSTPVVDNQNKDINSDKKVNPDNGTQKSQNKDEKKPVSGKPKENVKKEQNDTVQNGVKEEKPVEQNIVEKQENVDAVQKNEGPAVSSGPVSSGDSQTVEKGPVVVPSPDISAPVEQKGDSFSGPGVN